MRAIDLPRLDADTQAAIAHASTRAAAQQAIRKFVAAFQDAHFRVDPLGATEHGETDSAIAAGTAVDAACAALGVPPLRPARVDWSALAGAYTALPSDVAALTVGLVSARAGDRPVGVLRVALFAGWGYGELCARAWRERASPNTACDAACQQALSQAMDQALIDAVAARLRALAAARPRAILFDLTGNGGGSDAAIAIARMVTARDLPQPVLGFIRQPHWAKIFARAAADFRSEASSHASLTAPQLAWLARSGTRADAARVEAGTSCDLSSLWRGAPHPGCSGVGHFAGYLDSNDRIDLAGIETRGYAHPDADYQSAQAVWTGPLWLVVDHGSASATEQFAAMLQDHAGAVVIGQPTLGIGCGYTDGGTRLDLPALGLVARAPDCIRYRADGSSEANGVQPQISVDWQRGDDPATRAGKLLRALPTE
jgi:hypothetical protein